VSKEAVNPELFTGVDESLLPSGAPDIAVVVSLWFPGMGGESLELMTRFTRVAFDAVRAAGGRPHLIDSSAEEFVDPSSITGYDGVLFLGGGDVDATLYGYTDAVPNSYGIDRRADDYCIDLIQRTVDEDMRVLAICRGSQLLNVAFGGTLIPDIDDFARHRGGPGKPTFLDEPIDLVQGSKVSEIFGRDQIVVRSGHHQAVAEVAPVLRATAFAEDGIIEGTEHPDKTWVVGVQWHPEDSDGDDVDRARIFGAFVEQCRQVRDEKVRLGNVEE
jgi:putative glutamine amidotransferase